MERGVAWSWSISIPIIVCPRIGRLPTKWKSGLYVSHTGTLQGGISNADELDMMLLGKEVD